MKQFHEMSADEIKDYRGPMFWAKIQTYAPLTKRYIDSDLEAPSKELLGELIKSIPDARVFARGDTIIGHQE